MILNYIKISLRNLQAQKNVSIINIICLSIAVGCAIVVYLFIDNHVNREWIHANAENIFLVEHTEKKEGDLVTYGTSPTPLGPALANEMPDVVRAVRIAHSPATIRVDKNNFSDRVRFVDTGFAEMFTIPLIAGDLTALQQKDAVFISEETAKRYFGDEDAIGQTLAITLPDHEEKNFIVRGVTAPIPSQSCVEFPIFISYDNRFTEQNKFYDWNELTQATFIQVNDPGDIPAISSRMERYVKLQNTADKLNTPAQSFVFDNLLLLKGNVANVKNSIVGRSLSWHAVILFSLIAILLLSLSCINFINISLAMTFRRLKEIGMRKVVGARKRQLVAQFLIENVVVCLLSFVVAIAVTGSLLLPSFNEIFGVNLVMDFTLRINLWLYLLGLLIVVGLASGTYPAFYISSFKPIHILRDRLKFGPKNKLMQVLLSMQFILAFVTMVISVGITLNILDLSQRDWGYDKNDIVVVNTNTEEEYRQMHKAASELPNVVDIAGTVEHVGLYRSEMFVNIDTVQSHAIVFEVGENYFETMGFQLKAGKFSHAPNTVVVNEEFARRFTKDYDQAVVEIDSQLYSVAGIVSDFHHEDFQNDIEPLCFRSAGPSQFKYIAIRTSPGTVQDAVTSLGSTWQRSFPGVPFNHVFQEDTFDRMYQNTNALLQILVFAAVMALVMSCLGFFGLATQRMQQKIKEVCIRKIFGISSWQSVLLVNSNFGIVMIVAAIIATPIGYIGLESMLDTYYTYHMKVGPAAFIISYAVVVFTMLLLISRKIHEITTTNPAAILRNE